MNERKCLKITWFTRNTERKKKKKRTLFTNTVYTTEESLNLKCHFVT